MDETLTLYYRPGSRAARVKMLLDMMDLTYRLHTLADGENRTEAYLALNPFGTVPTLTHGDRVILESGAQMMYLADLVPEAGMAPPLGSPERGAYYEWFVLNGATLEPLGTKGFQNPEDADAQAGLGLAMQVMQSRLQMPYALGARFSAVDVLLHWQLNMLQRVGVLANMPKAAEYHEGLNALMDWEGY